MNIDVIWKSVVGFENFYEVNQIGEIRSIRRVFKRSDGKIVTFQGKLLRPLNNNNGYSYVCLKGQKRIAIHRIVASAFINNPDNKPCVNHKNGIKSDNRLENLEWCTGSDNLKHAYKIGLIIPYDRSGDKNSNYKDGRSIERRILNHFKSKLQ